MELKTGFEQEYKKRHDRICPELSALLQEAGVRDYSIFLDEDSERLFAVQRLADNNNAASLPSHPI